MGKAKRARPVGAATTSAPLPGRLAPQRQRCGRGALITGLPNELGCEMQLPHPLRDCKCFPLSLSPALPRSATGVCLFSPSPDFVSRLGRALKCCRISHPHSHTRPRRPPPAAFPRSDLRADVPCSLTGKSPSPRLSLMENSRSRIRGGALPRPPKECSGVAPIHLPKRSTRESWLSEAWRGSKSVEEMELGRVGVGN